MYPSVSVEIGEVNADAEPADTSTDPTECSRPAVKCITATDIDAYTIEDVVLPLPGYNVQLPDNEVL